VISSKWRHHKAQMKHQHGDGKMKPKWYHSDAGWDLGLCFQQHKTPFKCPHGDRCEWQYDVITMPIRNYILQLGGDCFLRNSDKYTFNKWLNI
jgi:hypothetical protein